MQAITTHYRGPTASTGPRIAAAKQLATALGWNGKWVGGGVGDGYVFACDVGEWFTVTGAAL